MSSETNIVGPKGTRNPVHTRGSSQSGMRLYNERLVLSLIRRSISLPKAEIAKLTGLSAQTVSVIVRQLESDGLLQKENPQRGKVGQPLVPFSLNPDGAYSIGLKVGRRSGDLMLMDLRGEVRKTLHQPYRFPATDKLIAFAKSGLDQLTADLSPAQRDRIAGVGIAAPFELWNWEEAVGASHDVVEAWRDFDLQGEIGKICDWPVHFCNDATAACAAELLFGKGRERRDFVYFYIGFFVGGGIVINGSLFQGRSKNAGALGSFPVPSPGGGSQQLIRTASLYVLEANLTQLGRDPGILWRTNTSDWGEAADVLDSWIAQAARGLAHASVGAASVLDTAFVVIDGAIPANVRSRLVAQTQAAIGHIDTQGISSFSVIEGGIGADARAMGAASLPLFANFIIDRDVLFKEQQGD